MEGMVSVKLEYRGHFHLRSQPTTLKQKAGSGRSRGEWRRDEKKMRTVERIVRKKDTETLIVKVIEDGNLGKTSRYQLFSPLPLPEIVNPLLYYLFLSVFMI